MSSRIQLAVKDEHLVTLADVQRGGKGLTCYTCGDKLAVKDGRGQRVTGIGRRHQARRKHFSHTSNSRCHGEGPAHYHVKTDLCRAINHALKMPKNAATLMANRLPLPRPRLWPKGHDQVRPWERWHEPRVRANAARIPPV